MMKENDRAAMTALHEYLPYAARAGVLPVPNNTSEKDYKRIIEHAEERIGLFEPKLWDEQEAQAQAELREINISVGQMEYNHRKLIECLDRHEHGLDADVKHIYRWSGLAPKDSHFEPGVCNPGLEILQEPRVRLADINA